MSSTDYERIVERMWSCGSINIPTRARDDCPGEPSCTQRDYGERVAADVLVSEDKAEDSEPLEEFLLCRRPGVASGGKAVKLQVNCVELSVDSTPSEIFVYHVAMARSNESDKDESRWWRLFPRALMRRVFDAVIWQYEAEVGGVQVVHDGTSLMYSPVLLPWTAQTKMFRDVDPNSVENAPGSQENSQSRVRTGLFVVSAKLVDAITTKSLTEYYSNPNVDAMPALQALGVILRCLARQRLVSVQRNFFSIDDEVLVPLCGGTELRWGYHQAVRVADHKLLLTLSRTTTRFYSPNDLMTLVTATLNVRSPSEISLLLDWERRKLARALRRIEVTPTHRNDSKRSIYSISTTSASETMVNVWGKTISVVEYFSTKYNIQLQHPNLPLKAPGDVELLSRMLHELLLTFYQATSQIPQRVVYYRGGASQDQYFGVLQAEMKALRKAFKLLSADCKPRVTFIAVNKRHHLRAFPMNSSGENNVEPGTIIDTGVVDAHGFDFYFSQKHEAQRWATGTSLVEMTATGATTAPGRRLGMKISAAEEATPLRVQAHATTIRVAVVATGPALAATVEGTITIGAKATPTADATATTMIAMVLLRLVAIPKAAALDMVGATTVLVATAMTDCVVMVVTTMAKPPGVETIMVALAREATTTPPRLAVLQGDTIKDALRLKARCFKRENNDRDYGSSRGQANRGYGGGFEGRDTKSFGGNGDSNPGDSRSYGRNWDSGSRDNRNYGGNREGRGYGGNGGNRGGRGGGRYGGYGGRGGRERVERGPGIGEIRGCGYEAVGDSIMDPRLQDLWTGRAPPMDVNPEDPELQMETRICRRPGVGTEGRTMSMNVNYFSVSLDKAPPEIFKYHVDVVHTPEDENTQPQEEKKMEVNPPRVQRPLPRSIVRNVINAALRQYEAAFEGFHVVHDGMSALYSPSKLEWNSRDFPNVNPDGPAPNDPPTGDGRRRRGPRTFIVKMKLAEAIAVSSLQAHYDNPDENVMPVLQSLDVVARHLGAQRLVSIGRNFFGMKKTHELKGGKELCWGYHQAIRVAEKKLLMNVDQAATVFYEPCELMKLAMSALNARSPMAVRDLCERDMKNLARVLRKVEVVPTHRKDRKRAIFGVSPDRADRTMVDIKGETMSVAEYFYRKYNLRLQHPNLPLVNVGSKKAGRENWLPIELCDVAPGQRCPNINDLDTVEIIRQTSQPPSARRENILTQVRQAGFENDPFLDAFGMQVGQQLERTDVRVLDPPDVQYANVSERPTGGQWNLRDKKFVTGAVLRIWGVVVDANVDGREVGNFIGTMVETAGKCGLVMECRNPLVIDRSGGQRGEVEDLMKTCYRELEARGDSPPQLIMVIKQDKGSVSYGRIKRTSDTVLGIPSQCIVASNLRRANLQLCANVCLKMNMKLSGKNSVLREPLPLVSSCPTIVIGADVEHPRSGMGSRPSIASVVASMDAYSAKYIGRVAVQKAANDIQQLPHMLRDLFLSFYRSTDRRPERVVYYRDGLSEGRFYDVLQTEMRALRKTFKMLSDDYNPPVTFVVVNKRHHMRAFPVNAGDADKKGNVVPGTVIDTGVVSPHRFDFFLYGHSGIQGTSVPCHYTVLHDENGMSADDLQRLTYHLGYTFSRCTRSVSFATPAYYAGRARFFLYEGSSDTASMSTATSNSSTAGRARFFLYEGSSDTASMSTATSNSSTFDFAGLHKNMLDCMFYV
ncbi:Protein argonaute 12 [Phytophthora fragariae]|uniref:Protein argonaute 12 n=5 Tax=Phytophthora fragariae TaxID=53985 RepID=A0A6G0LTL0_9STRA|nr:Protein argonaute 12 [Phytophthora fragariae]